MDGVWAMPSMEVTVRGTYTPNNNNMAMATAASMVLLADDASVVGVADDILIPFLFGAAYLADKNKDYQKKWTWDLGTPFEEPHKEFNDDDKDKLPKEWPKGFGIAIIATGAAMLTEHINNEVRPKLQPSTKPIAPADKTRVVPTIKPKY